MTENGILQIVLYLVIIIALVKPLGSYMANVYQGKFSGLDKLIGPIERLIYRWSGISVKQEMNWKTYLRAMLIFNLLGILVFYGIIRIQNFLPLNVEHFSEVPADLSFNTAVSFATNTDWQAYSGETTLSYFSQLLAVTVQSFLSAATGMAILVAFIRGLTQHENHNLGNFWVDLVRGILYILMPLSLILAIVLASQGVIQNFKPYEKIDFMQPVQYQQAAKDSQGNSMKDQAGNPLMKTVEVNEQVIPMGPVASQIAIKQLGSNGGGFFNTNSAHPFENPTPISNFLEMLAILLIPAAFCYTFGVMVNDKRQGWAIFIAMLLLFIPFSLVTVISEQIGNPAFTQMGITQTPLDDSYPGGNMEGKETRFGIINSTLWASAATATSNGSVSTMYDSFTPLAGLIPLWFMHIGEVVFGGVGSGLYGMLMIIILTVFVAGLMVGRTPEYLGKKIEPFEMKMASIAVLVEPLLVLFLTALSSVLAVGTSSIANPGAHGFTEILYTFASMGSNNGSAFAGLNANTPYYTIVGGIEILFLRYWLAISALAIAGSLANKKIIPKSAGTLPTHTPLFIILIMGISIIIGALSFFPALALGPIVEHLMLWGQYGH